MNYDPFQRGPRPVGVRSSCWHDVDRDLELLVETWYPAADHHRGQDLEADTQDVFDVPGLTGESGSMARQAAVRDAESADGSLTAVLLVHGFSGHRRESTFMATHLASHGFLVVSADHPGSTYGDISELLSSAKCEGRRSFTRTDIMPSLVANRRSDIPFMINRLVECFDVDRERIGISGASFGGWTSLVAPSLDDRIKASAPMCPSGGETPVYPRGRNVARDALDFDWKTDTATLFMVADRDSWLPLYGQIELFRRTPGPKRLIVLEQADHNHFVDSIEEGHAWLHAFTASLAEVEAEHGTDWRSIANAIVPYSELCPEEKAHMCWRGLCTAHMDSHLRQSKEAQDFLEGDLLGAIADRGIDAVEICGRSRT